MTLGIEEDILSLIYIQRLAIFLNNRMHGTKVDMCEKIQMTTYGTMSALNRKQLPSDQLLSHDAMINQHSRPRTGDKVKDKLEVQFF